MRNDTVNSEGKLETIKRVSEMSKDHPAWLVRMENGSIAEARTKALLIDRFWILERSVDIEGADFIIQRKLTSKTLLDRDPPRFGIIQTKFFSDENTTHYLHREYVLDAKNEPQDEFFLICHTGVEEESKSFLLDSKQIVQQFELTTENHSRPLCFKLPGKQVLGCGHFTIVNRHLVLDRVERALQQADFRKNRSFLSWAIPSIQISPNDISLIYLEPLDNWWGDIPKEFYELKKKAQASLFRIEDAGMMLHEILSTNDPGKALTIAADIEAEYGKSYPFASNLFDEDFLNVVREHKERYDKLRETGTLDSFLSLRIAFINFICDDLAPRMKISRDSVYIVNVKYDRDTFLRCTFTSKYKKVNDLFGDAQKPSDWFHKDIPDTKGILKSKAGSIQVYWLPGRYCFDDFVGGKFVPREIRDWKPELIKIAPTRILMEEIYRLRFLELNK